MSCLYLRGNSVWIKYYMNGLRTYESMGCTLEKIVRRSGKIVYPQSILDRQNSIDEMCNNTLITVGHINRGSTVSEIRDQYLETRGSDRSKSTKYCCRLAIKKVIEFMGDVEVAHIVEDDMIEWRKWLVESEGAANAARNIRHTSAILNWAVEKKYLIRNPITKDVKIQTPEKPVLIFTDAQLTSIIEACDEDLKDIVMFLLHSGFRMNEALCLQWQHIDFSSGTIMLENVKAGRQDVFPIDESLLSIIKDIPTKYSPYVFRWRSKWNVSRFFKKILKSVGIGDGYCTHTLRKNFISSVIRSGASNVEAMYLARHRSIATTLKYYTVFDIGKMRSVLGRSRQSKS